MQDDQLSDILRFFAFAIPNPDLVTKLAAKTLEKMNVLMRGHRPEEFRKIFIKETTGSLILNKIKHSQNMDFSGTGPFYFSEKFDLRLWTEFMKTSPMEEKLCLIWTLAGFTNDEISEGADLSMGTVKYRLAKAYRHIGSMKLLLMSLRKEASP